MDEIDRSTGTPLNDRRLLLRRGRLRADAVRGPISARLELDANTISGITVRPFEATVSWRVLASVANDSSKTTDSGDSASLEIPRATRNFAATVQAGLMKIPFGYESTETDRSRPLLERSLGSRALLASARDLGLGLEVRFGTLGIAVAYMNGEPLDESQFGGLDPNSSKDLVGRAGVDVPLLKGLAVHAGVSGASGSGFHAGTAAVKPTLLWADGSENGLVEISELATTAGSPATPSASFARAALGADCGIVLDWPVIGQTSLSAEVLRAKNYDRGVAPADPIGSGRDLREFGWSVRIAQELSRHGQVAARYAYYDPDADATRRGTEFTLPKDASMSLLSLAVAARLSGGRLLLEYDHNSDHLARSIDGSPTRLRDDIVTLRMEVALP